MNKHEFIEQALEFLEKIFSEIHKKNITIEKHWSVDHLCYRTLSLEVYENLKLEFQKFSKLLIESEVNGRPISTFKLNKPIRFLNWDIHLVELPAPKKGKLTIEGFEHIEVVCDVSFEEIKNRYPKNAFNESGLIKNFNQELEISFGESAIKFHHLSLESVVRLESNKTVFLAIENLGVLKSLKEFKPLIAGTYPLGIQNSTSDVDVLVCSHNLILLRDKVVNQFQHHKNFKISEVSVGGEPTFFSSFEFDGIAFEIFAQNIESVRQRGYLHFLIEERLLMLGGDSLKNKIIEQRKHGYKTEPAFAKVLNLHGDPYMELLTLQTMDEEQLRRLIEKP